MAIETKTNKKDIIFMTDSEVPSYVKGGDPQRPKN